MEFQLSAVFFFVTLWLCVTEVLVLRVNITFFGGLKCNGSVKMRKKVPKDDKLSVFILTDSSEYRSQNLSRIKDQRRSSPHRE